MTFTKSDPAAQPRFFEWEAAGLDWLCVAESSGGARCVRVVDVGIGMIVLDDVPQVCPTIEAARGFGRALARTHREGAPAFGSPPEGWDGPAYIGRRSMPCRSEDSWGRFYAEQRVRPFLETALVAGNLRPDEARLSSVLSRLSPRACSTTTSRPRACTATSGPATCSGPRRARC